MSPFQNWSAWSQTPLGERLLSEEQKWYDQTLQDVFGYHAVQLGPSPLDTLKSNRMSCRTRLLWPGEAADQHGQSDSLVVARYDELPFQSHSIDMLVLAHALEVASDPHQLLREAERVLIPEGKLVISGFNPFSLWALRKRCRSVNRFPPAGHDWIGLARLKDWLKLLNFDIGGGRASAHGMYLPPFDGARWIERFQWTEPAGRRWWPLAGSVYYIAAVKRVSSIRLVGPAWREKSLAGKKAVAAVSSLEMKERHTL